MHFHQPVDELLDPARHELRELPRDRVRHDQLDLVERLHDVRLLLPDEQMRVFHFACSARRVRRPVLSFGELVDQPDDADVPLVELRQRLRDRVRRRYQHGRMHVHGHGLADRVVATLVGQLRCG
jgi:hypothetical protein